MILQRREAFKEGRHSLPWENHQRQSATKIELRRNAEWELATGNREIEKNGTAARKYGDVNTPYQKSRSRTISQKKYQMGNAGLERSRPLSRLFSKVNPSELADISETKNRNASPMFGERDTLVPMLHLFHPTLQVETALIPIGNH